MIDEQDRMARNRYGITSMWINWTISAAAFALVLLLSLLIPKVTLPLACLAISVVLYICVRVNRASVGSTCSLMPFVMSRALFISALVMLVINLLHKRHYINLIFADVELINPQIPFVTILVIGPVTVLMTAWALIRKTSLPLCVDCISRHGSKAERGFIGEFLAKEGPYQVRLMLYVTLFITVVDYIYYFVSYINVNLNAPDIFFFNVAPILLMAATIVIVGIRYLGSMHFFRQNFGHPGSQLGRVTKVRYLIVCDEEMLLDVPLPDDDLDINNMQVDTPVTLTLRRRKDVTLESAEEHFHNITNLDNVDMRFLYANRAEYADANIFHFLVVLPDKKLPEDCRLKGEWFTLPQISVMIENRAINPLLMAEIARLHEIAMAWKTYDRRGMRRYQIRNYRPAFRISDLANDKIDFSDNHWLYISKHNEDKPFYRLRHLWGRHVSGTFDKGKTAEEKK